MPNNQSQQGQAGNQGKGVEKEDYDNKPEAEGQSNSKDNYGGQSDQPGLPDKSDEEWSPGSDRTKESEELWSPGSDKPNE
ncbi:MAG: hypothetical protein ACR2M8_10740 [Pyrinomonadaceae bacterium]|nr:hypothetical protein [Blastocatellia bacterium]MDQ3220556.1 hypothetical protein [Acidobacteriota bacterium]MDQ3490293.1 hypothetical protein [Acidobacteriota bacterium]